MIKLVACLVIVSLILASGAIVKEVNQIFNEDSYVYKSCYKARDGEKECKINEEDKFEGNPYKICDLNYEKYNNTSLLSFGYRNVILSFTDGNDHKIVTVDLRNCAVKEVNFGIDIKKIRKIVVREDNFYIIFYDEVCKEFYCKAIYDSNGKIVKGRGVTPLFGVYAASDLNFNIAGKGLLMNEYRLDGQVNLYFIPFDDFLNPDSQVLFSVPHGNWYGISTLENKLGFCAFDDGKTVANSTKKIVCQQYDAEGKTKTMESIIQIKKENHVEFLKATNFDKGLFALVNEWQGTNDGPVQHTFLVYMDENGKQGKPVEIDVKCDKELDPNFHVMDRKAYKIFYTCYDPFDSFDRFRNSTWISKNIYPPSRMTYAFIPKTLASEAP